MNLDKELAEIARPERAMHEREVQKTSNTNRFKRAQKLQLRTQQFVMSCIAVLFLLFYFENDINETSQQAALTDQPIEITVLKNQIPERELNLNSPMYFQKKSTSDEQILATFQSHVTDANIVVVDWDGQIQDSYGVYDVLLTYDGGQQHYLKLSTESINYELIDVIAQQRYVLPNDTGKAMYRLIADIERQQKDNGWKLYVFLALIVLILIDSIFISRKSYIKDEEGKRKKGRSSIRFFSNMLMYIPLLWGEYILGAKHLGLIVIGCIMSFVICEYFEVRLGIKHPQWKWAFTTMMVSIVFFLLIIL
ncbi:hypothetical protein [Solibacillus sp. CAU 1738]|uniref:hypothetical protein n=1 Tax=Solibacillus sp. CAU 1738 TaxID=3140363 RepID=UPI0032600C0D